MARENEIKIDLKIPFKDFVKRILNHGYKKEEKLIQEDIYFDTKDWDLYHHIASFRLRKTDDFFKELTFKKVFCLGRTDDRWYVDELETKFPDFSKNKMKKICKRLGMNFVNDEITSEDKFIAFMNENGYLDEQHMKKERSIYRKDNFEIVIDRVDKVGIIVEIETVEEVNLHLEIDEILNEEEWERTLRGTGYIWLQNVKGLPTQDANFKKFDTNPGWNVLDCEKDFYKSISI